LPADKMASKMYDFMSSLDRLAVMAGPGMWMLVAAPTW